jgi:cell volume regulation protein A
MNASIEYFLIYGALLLIAGVAASKLSDRFGIPALLLFLGIGMLAGSDGPGGIYFDDPLLASEPGTIALL